MADQMLFYLVNMEATFESNNKLAERLRLTQEQHKAELARQKISYENSASWRVTAPLRALKNFFKPKWKKPVKERGL